MASFHWVILLLKIAFSYKKKKKERKEVERKRNKSMHGKHAGRVPQPSRTRVRVSMRPSDLLLSARRDDLLLLFWFTRLYEPSTQFLSAVLVAVASTQQREKDDGDGLNRAPLESEATAQ